ncbi:hypothetical protein B0T18DRAFT_402236 [Schizothecium vesticola]|uniref:Extracellular membrane protein CFEM domain-containing protein n=1 Tax=Schizothecium vesticola TaxID=314040 RepID=A0AA40F4W5_9PEZI|nr:hypothetical protein B0T18DRAFT_402236 [Schizothecium vesticola]
MQLSVIFLQSLLAMAIASPVSDSIPAIQKRDCYSNCIDGCNAGKGGSCSWACTLTCSIDYSGNQRTTSTNLDDFVHNWDGTLVCFNRHGSK